MTEVRLFLCVAAMSFIAVTYQESKHADMSKPGEYEIKFQASPKVIVRCSVKIIKYSPDMFHNRCWGSDWTEPRTVIGEINIWTNDRRVMVPLSCYADLSNPNWGNLLNIHGGYRLYINGGDAASGYWAIIDFNGTRVVRREVHDGEQPKAAWETTVYYADTTGIY